MFDNSKLTYRILAHHDQSVEDKVSSDIELHIGNNAADKLQENQQSKMRLDLMSRFYHRVRHSLQHRRVTARMNRWHCHPLKEWEFLHCQSFIKILALNIEANVIVGDGSTVVFGGTEIHARRVVVLIVNDVHLVVPIIFNIVLLLLEIPTLKHHDLFITLLHHLVLDLDNLRLFQ